MDHQKKLLELCGISTLKEYADPKAVEDMMQSGQYYQGVCNKIFAQGDMQLERVFGEMSRLLADGLQPAARAKYGLAGPAAIRQLLSEEWDASGGKDGWEQQLSLIQTAARQMGLNSEQEKAFLGFMERLPGLLMDFFANEAARLKLIPLDNVDEMTRLLAEMFKEERHADPIPNNQ